MEKEIKFYPGSILMILGYKCTNSCSYCYLKKNGAKMEENEEGRRKARDSRHGEN